MRYLFALLAACGSTPAPPPAPPATPTTTPALASAALDRVAWIVGDWHGTDTDEHWVSAHTAIYGVSLGADGAFEVMILDEHAGGDGIDFLAMPGGQRSATFVSTELADGKFVVAREGGDFPAIVEYARTGDALRGSIADAARSKVVAFPFTRSDLPRAPALEQADLAFAADVNARGVDGWLAAFAADGGMLRKGERITGAAIGEMMRPVLGGGTLAWAPIDSGVRGAIGFTVGKATFTGATPADGWKSTYVTIWKQQADGGWKVLFDTGRPDE